MMMMVIIDDDDSKLKDGLLSLLFKTMLPPSEFCFGTKTGIIMQSFEDLA